MSLPVFELPGTEDTISSLNFSENNPVYLLVSSWDGHLRLFDVTLRSIVRDFKERAPILDATFITETLVASASIDGALRFYDLEHGRLQQERTFHKSAVKSLVYAKEHDLLIAGSWDHSISVQNPLSRSNDRVVYIQVPEKVFALSANKEHLVVAMANRLIYIYSFAQLASALETNNTALKPLQRRESSLKFMTRTIQCTLTTDADMEGYVSTSVEGRVAVEFIDPSETSQARKYAFKCHRQKAQNDAGKDAEDVVYPVNAIAFHPKYKTFASGGGDGVVSVWDLKAKKRVKQYPAIEQAIQVLAFSPNSKYLAIGTGLLGSDENAREGKVYLRALADGEARGKS